MIDGKCKRWERRGRGGRQVRKIRRQKEKVGERKRERVEGREWES